MTATELADILAGVVGRVVGDRDARTTVVGEDNDHASFIVYMPMHGNVQVTITTKDVL